MPQVTLHIFDRAVFLDVRGGCFGDTPAVCEACGLQWHFNHTGTTGMSAKIEEYWFPFENVIVRA
jgi:hypothetical protein